MSRKKRILWAAVGFVAIAAALAGAFGSRQAGDASKEAFVPDTATEDAAAATSEPPPPGSWNLLVLGDSLSSAYGLAREQGWVAQVESRLRGQGSLANFVNASVAGETTRGGLYRLPALLDEHLPRLVIIALGANDGLRGLKLDSMADNLGQLIQLSQGSGAEVILAAIPVTSNYGSYVLERMQDIYRQASADASVPLVDFFGRDFVTDPSYFQDDGLHPNASAQERIAEAFWPELLRASAAIDERQRASVPPPPNTQPGLSGGDGASAQPGGGAIMP